MVKGTGTAPENLGGTAIKPVGWDRTGLEAFKYFLYNPDTGEILSRTPLSWIKIFVFYNIYYFFLTAFWLGCLFVFFLTLPPVAEGPKWKNNMGLIGSNPGVGLRPANSHERIDSQMFVLNARDTGEGGIGGNIEYAYRLQDFLSVYQSPATKPYHTFDLAKLGECGQFPYGFVGNEVSPCIFLKLNKIWDWYPEPINEDELKWNPYFPAALRDHWEQQKDKDNVWINCEGRFPADKEALGDIEYFPPSRGIPVRYFPFTGGNYHSPLVAIKIRNAKVGQLIHMECRAYYQGVMHDTKNKMGLVQFEVLFERKW